VAALFPANVSYLYFVADSDGHHEFRTTLSQHDVAKRDVKRPTLPPPAKARKK
jgi:cell division protein YceG involved in septum cleavage